MIFLKNPFSKKIFQLSLKNALFVTFHIHREWLLVGRSGAEPKTFEPVAGLHRFQVERFHIFFRARTGIVGMAPIRHGIAGHQWNPIL